MRQSLAGYPADEEEELRSLRALLARTSHTPRHLIGAQCGSPATLHLKALDDGSRGMERRIERMLLALMQP